MMNVPRGLSNHGHLSIVEEALMFNNLLTASKIAQPPPNNGTEASQLVIQNLHRHRNVHVQGLLFCYELPPPLSITMAMPPPAIVAPAPTSLHSRVAVATRPRSNGVEYELHSLPVASKDVIDGDTLVLYVDTSKDTREHAAIPQSVAKAFKNWRLARKRQDLNTGKALEREISSAGYKVIDGKVEILAHKYKVRLRGIDAPESSMPYGPEAKSVLLHLVEGQPLRVLVYAVERYGRVVADIYCKDRFVQEILLKKGCAWHYPAYDHSPKFAKWQQEAREASVGLWKRMNPQEPWEYRKDHQRGG